MRPTLSGLVRWASKPASIECRMSASWPQPVAAIRIIARPQAWPRRRRATSCPLRSGMPMSSSATAGRCCSAICRASSPLRASTARKPESSSSLARPQAASPLSSATRISSPSAAAAGLSGCGSRLRAPVPWSASRAAGAGRRAAGCPGSGPAELAMIQPPCSSTMLRASASPMPRPPLERLMAPAACENRSNMRSISLGLHADAVVLDRDHHLVMEHLGPHRDAAAFGRVLGGVAHQVGHHLGQPQRIAVDLDRHASGSASTSSWPAACTSGRVASSAAWIDGGHRHGAARAA